MCLKIRCDGESEKFCKFFCEVNKAWEWDRETLPHPVSFLFSLPNPTLPCPVIFYYSRSTTLYKYSIIMTYVSRRYFWRPETAGKQIRSFGSTTARASSRWTAGPAFRLLDWTRGPCAPGQQVKSEAAAGKCRVHTRKKKPSAVHRRTNVAVRNSNSSLA